MEELKNIKVALLGSGTVGTGVYKLIERQREELPHKVGAGLTVSKVLVRDKNKKREGIDPSVLTDQWEDIITDDEIQIVVEVMGGIEPARTYITEALQAGKNVVTANKDLMAVHGGELLDIASHNGCDLLFEASVAGGIPIIRPLKQCLAGNYISEAMGIVNGTTNFILTKMTHEGMEFDEALALATELGYAEADPTSDIEGYDAQYKLAILASLAFGTKIDIDKVYRQGITNITSLDMEYAKSLGMVIKLLAIVKEKNGKLELRVHPTMIPETHPLANVYDSFNAVFIKGNAVGDLMFYGRGAGDLPTGSAVVADIISVIRDEIASKENSRSAVKNELWKKELMDISEVESRYYIRLSVEDKPGVLADLTAILGYNKVSLRSVMQKGKSRSADGGVILVLTTHHTTEADVKASLETMKKLESVKSIDNLIRIEDFTR